jgi:hypothetical protein
MQRPCLAPASSRVRIYLFIRAAPFCPRRGPRFQRISPDATVNFKRFAVPYSVDQVFLRAVDAIPNFRASLRRDVSGALRDLATAACMLAAAP